MRKIKIRLTVLVVCAGLIAFTVITRNGHLTLLDTLAAFVLGWALCGTFHQAAKYAHPEDAA